MIVNNDNNIFLGAEQIKKLISLGLLLENCEFYLYKFTNNKFNENGNLIKIDDDFYYEVEEHGRFVIGQEKSQSSWYECTEIIPTLELQGVLKEISKIEYSSFGFPIVQLYYGYNDGLWRISFRNPEKFENPGIKNKSPLQVAYETLIFLLERNGKI